MQKCSLFLLLFVFLFSAGAPSPAHSAGDSQEPSKSLIQRATIAAELKAGRFKDIYFSGQPTMEQINMLKAEGFAAIVNLRLPGEYNELEERQTAKSAGLNYGNFPIDVEAKLNNATIDSITNFIVKNRPKGKVLVHCSSGNRAGLWAGAHFRKDHGLGESEAIAVARNTGVTKEKVMKRLQEYLDSFSRDN